MSALRGWLDRTPPVNAAVTLGAVLGALLGAVAGLVIGLLVNPGTAWFAVFEVGVPTTVAGTLFGLLVGLLVLARRRVTAR